MHPYIKLDPLLEEAELDDEMEENGTKPGLLNQENLFGDLDVYNEIEEVKNNEISKVFSCQFCTSLFNSKKDLRCHIRSKHILSCFWTCRSCGATHPDLENLKVHLIKVHKSVKESFTLDDPELNPLLKPWITIPQDIKFCPECNGKFANTNSLNLHLLRRHISKRLTKNVQCPVCLIDVDDLSLHVKSDHGIFGVVCPHCGKILSKRCTLNRHIEQVHLNLQIHKPATCQECGKVFSKKGHLDRHIKTIHRGLKEASEPCPYCGKTFSTKSSLEPHIEMVHKGVRKKCPECGKILSDLWKHMRTVHGFYRRKTKIPKESLNLNTATEELNWLNNQPGNDSSIEIRA